MVVAAGCASTQEIETTPPQPRERTQQDDTASASEAPLSVVMLQGQSPLDEDVSLLRFRIAEIHLRREDGRWVRLPSDSAPLEFSKSAGARRTLLTAPIAPAEYDSLMVTFDDVFVRFGPNTGAPLTTSDETPQLKAVSLEPALGELTTLALQMEPGASLTRSPDCRWFFVPVIRANVTARPLPTSNTAPLR